MESSPRPVGRNDPCPCGSGKKYKKCHYAADQAAQRTADDALPPVHELDNRLVERLAEYATDRFGERWLRARDAFVSAENAAQLFWPWAVYHFPVDGRSAADWFMAELGQTLSADERDWLEAQRGTCLSVWKIREVTPGTGVTVEDLLTGETRRVVEARASRQLVPGDSVLARVVDHGGISLFIGLYPQALPPLEAAEVVRSVRSGLQLEPPVPVVRLRNDAVERHLISSWEQGVARGSPSEDA